MTAPAVDDRQRYPNDFDRLETLVKRCKELLSRAASPQGSLFDLDEAAKKIQGIFDPAAATPRLVKVPWQEIVGTELAEIGLPKRTEGLLIRSGIWTLVQLLLRTEGGLRDIRNVKDVAIRDISRALDRRGLRLLTKVEFAADPEVMIVSTHGRCVCLPGGQVNKVPLEVATDWRRVWIDWWAAMGVTTIGDLCEPSIDELTIRAGNDLARERWAVDLQGQEHYGEFLKRAMDMASRVRDIWGPMIYG